MLRIARELFNFKAMPASFMRRICANAGLGPRTAIPPGIGHGCYTMESARNEAREVMFGAVDQLLAKTGVNKKDIGIVVTNCSLFCPTPSLAAMIINHYQLGKETNAYAMGGQGCGCGPAAVDLCYSQLILHHNVKYALLVSTENITQNFYKGCDKSMLLPNVLFRMGASACLFSIKRKGKYECVDLLKNHFGSNQGAFESIYQKQDDQGMIGVSLSKKITKYAQLAISRNMTRLFIRELPIYELFRYAICEGTRQLFIKLNKRMNGGNDIVSKVNNNKNNSEDKSSDIKVSNTKQDNSTAQANSSTSAQKTSSDTVIASSGHTVQKLPPDAPKMPRIQSAFQHFCFHTGGRGVLDGMQLMFNLSEHQMAASRASLWRYGNVSSASIWYELAYLEQRNYMHKGDKTWQIAFGSGFKVNSIVWKCRKQITEKNMTKFDEGGWIWEDVIGKKDQVEEAELNRDYETEDALNQKAEDEKKFQEFVDKYSSRINALVEKDVKQEQKI